MRFEIPPVSSKVFLEYAYSLSEEMKSIFKHISKEAASIIDSSKTIHEMETELLGLFDESHKSILKAKAESINPKRYGSMIKTIIGDNRKKAAEAILEADRKRFVRGVESLKIKTERPFVPDVQYAIKRSSSVIKAADQGKIISQTRRDEMRKIIKGVMSTEPLQTRTGLIRQDVQKKVKKALKEYFEGYTKDSPPYGIPKNLESIAVTETKSLINNVRYEYMQMAANNMPDNLRMTKTWRHNMRLVKSPRLPHVRMNGVTVPIDQKFKFQDDAGIYSVDGPHDPILPAGSSIGCHCDTYFTLVRTDKK